MIRVLVAEDMRILRDTGTVRPWWRPPRSRPADLAAGRQALWAVGPGLSAVTLTGTEARPFAGPGQLPRACRARQ